MRYLALLLTFVAAPAFAQEAKPADQAVMQALLSEVQQLRLAIERSTLLGTRTQLALSRLQIQEAAATRATQQLYDVRQQGIDVAHTREQDALTLKQLEDSMPIQDRGPELRDRIKLLRAEMDELAAREQNRSARESELASQLQAAQNELAATRAQIADMERQLDAAIQQLLKH